MRLIDLVSHPRTIQWGLRVSRRVSPATAGRLARWLARLLIRLDPPVVRILKDNLRQVLGPQVSPSDLDRTAQQAFYYFVRGYHDLFRALQLSKEELLSLIQLPQWALDRFLSVRAAGRGVILVMAHVGNFDLAGQVVAGYVQGPQVMTLPNPSPGFAAFNDLRRRSGMDITPLSAASLRQALRTLRQGGVLVLGGDRPVSDLDDEIAFFGRPARLPSAHVRLALKTNALVVLLCCYWDEARGAYAVHVEPFLEMVRTGNAEEELEVNMRRVVSSLENVIRHRPEQWFMFVPVWSGSAEA